MMGLVSPAAAQTAVPPPQPSASGPPPGMSYTDWVNQMDARRAAAAAAAPKDTSGPPPGMSYTDWIGQMNARRAAAAAAAPKEPPPSSLLPNGPPSQNAPVPAPPKEREPTDKAAGVNVSGNLWHPSGTDPATGQPVSKSPLTGTDRTLGRRMWEWRVKQDAQGTQ